jgi:hypothetical protein
MKKIDWQRKPRKTEKVLKKNRKNYDNLQMRRKNSPVNISPERIVVTIVLTWAAYHAVMEIVSELANA